MERHIQELQSRATALRQKVDEAKSSQAASTSQNIVLDSLTKLSQTGRISGFHVSNNYHHSDLFDNEVV